MEGGDFFLALRTLEAGDDRPRLGESARPAEDGVRIGQEAGFGFAPRPVASLSEDEDGEVLRLRTFFFGLFGPNGPLPLNMTELAHARGLNRDGGFADFADALQHRMATLFYRAWAEGEPVLGLDRAEPDGFGRRVGALAGYGMASLEDRDAMPDLLKRHFTGRLADGARNPEGLCAILSSFFETPVAIEEFVPSRAVLPVEARCRLGGGAGNAALGRTASAGREVQVHHHVFRIVLGPMTLATYERFLPGGPALARLEPILRNYVGEALDWEVNLVLAAPEVPAQRLGHQGRLGFTSWLGARRTAEPARDLSLGRASRGRAAPA
ncbi:type VI secretion system baseplate subunit TssG [Falsirhodobacter sp. 20TX0035]|uniref:type VI secretion system baseplate subunit TssG n=1 Tax=Falsirhodobacter sp. 20TX0035 TaxID=3022019 RepID=UPI00232B9152|nr:type VI secretion system baseplate subunit TssG [Falsirhodobacter sp. 20TX0035]MDB6453060.1 type VI secretion system baseplate subunit TssG [Falsirhodobacter sp. 20TX0035]